VTRRLLTLFAIVATLLVAMTALAVPSWAATNPVFTPPANQVTRMGMALDFTGASVTSPQGEDLAVFVTADHGEVVPQGASTPLCPAPPTSPTPGQLCFFEDPADIGPLNFRGTESQVNQVLDGLTYIPDPAFPSPGASTLNDTLRLSATEQDIAVGLSSGMVTADVRVEPDNEAPVFASIPDVLTGVQTDVNQEYDFINDVEIDDPDQYPCDAVTPDERTSTVTATVGGTLATDYVSSGFVALGNGTATVVLTGSLTDINNAYDNLTYTPTPNTSYTGAINIFFNDEGCAGYGGDLTVNGTFPIEVVPGPATHFDVAAPPLADNGSATPVSVVAKDANGAVANDYAGTVELTSSDGSALLPPDAPLVAGAGLFPVVLNTDGNQTVTATDTVDSGLTGQSNPILVSTPQQVTHFVVDAPASATAGTQFDFTVTAEDANNMTVTDYAGTVHVTASIAGMLPPDATLTNGVGTFSATFTTASGVTLTATDTVQGSVTGSDTLTIDPAAVDHLDVDGPATAPNGTGIDVDVTARDAYGNLVQTYGGTVAITSSDGAAVLPANEPLVFGFRTFPVTLNTDGMQTITATDTVTSSITGTSGNIDVSSVPPGTATQFAVSATSTMTAGGIVDVQVTAQDAANATATGYSGTVHLSTTDPLGTVSVDATLTNGVGNFTVIVRTAGVTTITATDTVTASISGTDTVLVAPGAAAALEASGPANATAGSAVDITVTAHDSYDNLATGYAGTVEATSSDGAAVLPADFMLVGGTATVPVTFATAGSQTVTVTDTVVAGIAGTSSPTMVAAAPPGAATSFSVSSAATATAGVGFDVTVTARDAADATATGYSGTVQVTTTDAQGTVAANATLVNGVGTFPVTLRTAGAHTVTATDTVTASITGSTGSIVVSPSVTDHLVVEGPSTATNGSSVGITVAARDQYDNPTPAYSGTVSFTSTDASADLPADGTLTNGAGVFPATFNTNGSWTVTATDTQAASIDGTTGPILVSAVPPAPATHLSVTVPSGAVAGTPFNVTVTALDATDQTASAYSGTVQLTSSDAGAVLPADATLTNCVGILSVTLTTAGDQTITATDTVDASITGTSAAVTVTDPDVLPEPEATVDQSTIEAGSVLLVEGSGFLPGEQVQIWLHSDPVLLATVVADAAGTISHLTMVPADTPAGTHHIELLGLTSAVRIATADFIVTAAPAPAPTTTTTAPGATPTTAFDFFGNVASSAGSAGSSGTTTTGGSLPVTGTAVTGLLVAGLVLLTAGMVVLAGARRRSR